ISDIGSLKINLEIVGLNERLDQVKEGVMFRVLQEIISNIVKHAKASEVTIQLIRHENELSLLVEDNGIGFNVKDKLNDEGGGIGLKNIQSRVQFLNGQIFYDSYEGKGTTVSIEVPLG
ncbi:MAG: sensor histidine kinase, partial [Bacteroidia bacterium]